MCIFPEGYGSISRMYFLGAPGRRPALKTTAESHFCCHFASSAEGSYRSFIDMVGDSLGRLMGCAILMDGRGCLDGLTGCAFGDRARGRTRAMENGRWRRDQVPFGSFA